MDYQNFFHKCSEQDLCHIFQAKKIKDTEIHKIIHDLQDLGRSAKQAEYNKALEIIHFFTMGNRKTSI